MSRIVEVRVSADDPGDHSDIIAKAVKKSGIARPMGHPRILKRSLDARQRNIQFVYQVEVREEGDRPEIDSPPEYKMVHSAQEIHIVGAGPAGMFAALELLKQGLKPVIFERGKDVRARRRDLRAIQQFGEVNPDSNYCFGEGGAGTYSDGKLYTRSTKRGNIRDVIETLVRHGAGEDILIDAHPHIGSNKLPGIVSAMRETILGHGGEVHFGARVTDIDIVSGEIQSIQLGGDTWLDVDALILATGHSARDIYRILDSRGVFLEFKPFALGVRIEHPQSLIDSVQYKRPDRGEHLPAASYRLACQIGQHGVFSFCMCPGGLVVPASTAPGEIVVNGMSLSRRDSPFANAGTVVSVDEKMVRKNVREYSGLVEKAIAFQSSVEVKCFAAGDGTQRAPAQRLVDFCEDRLSGTLPKSSYIPGLHSYLLRNVLPAEISEVLKAGIHEFGRKMRGYYTNDAVVIATESRTSSPVRIPRSSSSLMSGQVAGLYPAGEGAGYAGGIISAAVDGIRVAQAVAARVQAS